MRNLLFVILIGFPVTLFSQAKEHSSPAIDSMIKELPSIPDTKIGKGVMLGNIGMEYSIIGNYTKALEYYGKAQRNFEKLSNVNGIARVTGNIGSTYLSMATDSQKGHRPSRDERSTDLHRAIEYLDRSIALAKSNGYLDVMNTFYKDLSESQRLLAYDEALDNASDKSNKPRPEDNVNIASNAGRRETEEKNKQQETDQLEEANKGKEHWYYIIGIGVLVIVFGSMFWTYTKQKATNKLISEEKKKADDLLLNILPAQVADELKEKGMTHAQQYDNVTVIITDFVGFTTVAERFSAKQLVGELHACFKAFDGMLEKYNVEKIKTVGDAYLAVAGLPLPNPMHAANAVSLAIMMRDFMLYRKDQLGDATFEMRIGVHTGSVVAGIVGAKKFAYDIWGDTVNFAARMEQNCEPGKINISESTYTLVKDMFHCDYRGEIMAKNKGKLKMYFVNEKLRQL